MMRRLHFRKLQWRCNKQQHVKPLTQELVPIGGPERLSVLFHIYLCSLPDITDEVFGSQGGDNMQNAFLNNQQY